MILETTNLPYHKRSGKVRDQYDLGDKLLLITTDRLTAFDRALPPLPYKSQVLNQLSAFWFKQTAPIISNHLIKVVSPEAMLVKKCKPLPLEVVVRAYLTGSTNTAIWTLYNQGLREFFGARLPDHFKKNAALPQLIVTPTSKSDVHDEPLNPQQVVDLIGKSKWELIHDKALELFSFASDYVKNRGLILVDTKFEFGEDAEGNILLIDECLTPDSSRYWRRDTYQERFKKGLEPESFDKEIIRRFYREHCDPYTAQELPIAPPELIEQVSQHYIEVYERISEQKFIPKDYNEEALCAALSAS